MYFGGNELKHTPRGLLIYHLMGLGKTKTFLASSLYSLHTN